MPVLGLTLGQTESQLNNKCKAYEYTIGSQDCDFIFYTYGAILAADQAVISRNPLSKLIIYGGSCTGANGNSFVVNQLGMIPLFVDSLFGLSSDIAV